MDLKTTLEAIAPQKFKLEDVSQLPALTQAMLPEIGNIDGYFRDDLIYSAFAHWILTHRYYSYIELKNLYITLLNNEHLFYDIGEQDTDSVFMRTFSALLFPPLLIAHRHEPYLDRADLIYIKEKLVEYLSTEKDRRGYVAGKGWAHAVAHTADALDDLAQCSEIDVDDLHEILLAIRKVVCIGDRGYTHAEEERLIVALLTIRQRGLILEGDWVAWIEGFVPRVKEVTTMPAKLVIHTNAKNFLQSFYFQLGWKGVAGNLQPTLDTVLKEINLFHKS